MREMYQLTEGTTGHMAHRSVSATAEGDVGHRCQQLERPVCKRSLGDSLEGLHCVLQGLSSSNWRRTMGHRACRSRCQQLERSACKRALGTSSDQGHRGLRFISQQLKRTRCMCEMSKCH